MSFEEGSLPLISIITINYNGVDLLLDCVQSVIKSSGYANFEHIIVDCASSDRSVERIRASFRNISNLKIIKLNQNVGYSEANNIGLRASKGELIALLSNDTIVGKMWLKELYQSLVKNPKAGCVYSKLLLMDFPQLIDSVGHKIDPLGFLRPEGYMQNDTEEFMYPRETLVAQVVACLMRRSVIDVLGLFDADHFIIHEDTDLSLRLHLAGLKVIMVPTSIVFHKRSPTLARMREETLTYLTRRNILMVILKNYELQNAFFLGFLNFCISLAIGTWYLFTQSKPWYLKAVIKAFMWNLRELPRTFAKRYYVQKYVRRVPDSFIFSKMDRINLVRLYRRRNDGPLLVTHLRQRSIDKGP